MPKASTYNIYTLNASTPPYGLWINIPFRTKGSTAIRDEAKTRGARFVPAAKGKMKWWLPRDKFTTETIAWLNTNQMIHSERSAPVFNANALQFSDINTALPFRLWLAVPFAHKDGVKNLGAKWCGDSKKWYFNGLGALTVQPFQIQDRFHKSISPLRIWIVSVLLLLLVQWCSLRLLRSCGHSRRTVRSSSCLLQPMVV
jgi:hypothetical protein